MFCPLARLFNEFVEGGAVAFIASERLAIGFVGMELRELAAQVLNCAELINAAQPTCALALVIFAEMD